MPKYTTRFDLGLADLDLIETALRSVVSDDDRAPVDAHAVHDLLGRLHQQKVFYRPENEVYISG